jgi:hypothetical protein
VAFKKLFIIVGICTIFIEILCGYLYFQRSWEKGSAIQWLSKRVYDKTFEAPKIKTAVDKHKYKQLFERFVLTVGLETQVIVVYIPEFNTPEILHKEFYRSLTDEHGAIFIDMSEDFSQFEETMLYLLPSDTHPSPMAHKLIAKKLSLVLPDKELCTLSNLNDPMTGPLPANVNQLRQYNGLGYKVITNDFGFRNIPRAKSNESCTMVAIGDSFTFGTGVNTNQTYVSNLNERLNEHCVLNAGVPGAGIEESLSTLEGLGKSSTPCSVILQVLDSDIL